MSFEKEKKDVRAEEVLNPVAVVVEKMDDLTMFWEICYGIVFESIMFALVSNLLTSAVAILEAIGNSNNLADVTVAADTKQHRELAPPSYAEMPPRHADGDENDVLPAISSEVKSLRLVWGRRSAGRLVHRVTSVLATRASSTCVEVPVVAETREVASTRPDTINDTFKFWKRRYSLFSKFDEGIMLDEESFYSVCPEVISKFMAEQCKSVKIAVDPFCGAGGNIIQLAKFCDKVIACDMDPHKIKMAKHNASLYGVSHKIEFIVGDFFELCGTIKGDVIVTSPPWGGLGYNNESTIGPSAISLDRILEAGKSITSKMLLHLPKNLSKSECEKVCQATELRAVKMENVYINKYVNCMLVYVKSNTSNCRDSPRTSDVRFHQPFYKNGQDGGKKSYRDYLTRVERSMKTY